MGNSVKTWREKLTANRQNKMRLQQAAERIDKRGKKYTERYGWKQKHDDITWEHALRSLQL